MRRYFGLSAVGVALLTLLVGVAAATPALDFNVSPNPGSISFAGGANPLVGAGITVSVVDGISTPLNNGAVEACVGCILSFTTGNLTGSDATDWFFGGGGSISITGAVPGAGAAGPNLLFGGSFGSAKVTNLGGVFQVAIAVFGDNKDKSLAAFYGLLGGPGVPWAGNLNISFNAAGVPPGMFNSTQVLSGDVVNSPVPEPASVALLGGVLLLGATRLRRNLRKS